MFALNGALFGIWASRIPWVAGRHELGEGQLGLLLLLLAGGAILSFPLAGRAADRFGAAPVTRRIAVAYVGALGLLALAPTPMWAGVALFCFGATHGAMDVTMNAWGAEVERALGRPVMSSFHAMFSLGAGLGAASGFLAGSANLGLGAHVWGLTPVLLGLALWLARSPWPSTRSTERADRAGLPIPRGVLLLVGIVAFCTALGEGAMADWSAVLMTRLAGADDGVAALGYAVFSVAMVAMRLAGDGLVRRIGPVRMVRLSGALAASGAALVVGVATVPAMLAGFGLMGLGYAVVMPLAFSRAANDPGTPPGAALAQVSVLAYGGMLLGPPLIGGLAELTSLRISFGLLLGLALVMTALAGVLRR